MTIRLQQEREARGFSRLRLSQLAMVTPATVGMAESGRFRPWDSQLRKLAKVLEISEDDAASLLDEVTKE